MAEDETRNGNREHDAGCDCAVCAHGGPVSLIGGGFGIGFVQCHEDGTTLAEMDGTGQRKPFRFDPTRDGTALRSHDRGQRGERARANVAWLLGPHNPIVEADRRGRDAGHGVTAGDKAKIIEEMRTRIDAGQRVTVAAVEVGKKQGYGERTVLEVWRGARR